MNYNFRNFKNSKIANVGIGIFAAYIYFYSLVNTVTALSNSFFYFVLIGIAILLVLLGSFKRLNKMYSYEILFILPIIILVLNYLNGHQKAGIYLFYFMMSFFIMVFMKFNINGIKVALKTILYLSIFYAVTIIYSSINHNFFQNNIYSYYSIDMQQLMYEYSSQGLYSGVIPYVATAAGFMVNGIALLVYNRNSSLFKFPKSANKILIMLLVISLILTGKRAMIIFTLISFILVYFLESSGTQKIKRFWKVLLAVIFTIVLILVFGSLFTGNNAFSRTVETFYILLSGMNDVDVTNGRSVLIEYAIELFAKNPLTGIGWWEYVINSPSYFSRVISPHNIYIQLLCETGVIGFVSFILPMLSCLIGSIKLLKNIKYNYQDGYFLSYIKISVFYQIYFLLYGMTGNPLYDYEFLLMYFLSIGIYGAIRYTTCNKGGKE